VDNTDTRPPGTAADAAQRHVTALYQAHALSLARLALLMLGDQAEAQDVVQDAFLGPVPPLGDARQRRCRVAQVAKSRDASAKALNSIALPAGS
jgi:hypothetical protein